MLENGDLLKTDSQVRVDLADLRTRVTVKAVTRVQEFAAMEAEWEGLRAASPSATPFQSWAWLYSWWEVYGGGRLSLRLVAAREGRGGALVGLAPLMVERIFETVREINQQGVTILLVEQNAAQALSLASRGYVIETGRIVLEDEASALLTNERVRKAYLGEE